jgi:hypothetical protein
MINIYLAGSIDGLTYSQATNWRINITNRFIATELDVKIFDPTAKYQNGSFKKDNDSSNKKKDRAEKISSLIAQIESAGHRDELTTELKNPVTSNGYKILTLCDECGMMGGNECVYDGDDEINCGTCDYHQNGCLLKELKDIFLDKHQFYVIDILPLLKQEDSLYKDR